MDTQDAFCLVGLAFALIVCNAARRWKLLAVPVIILAWVAWASRLRGRTSTIALVQAIISSWCAVGWLMYSSELSPIRKQVAATALLAHIVTVITFACTAATSFLTTFSDVSAGLFVLAHLPLVGASWCGLEVYMILTIASQSIVNDLVQHLTWWALFALAVFDGAIVLDYMYRNERKFAVLVAPSLRVLTWVVLIGVLVMSVLKCSLLSDAMRDNRPTGYILGNFAMHYYPALRSAFAKSKGNGVRAVAFVALYGMIHDAPDVYGCSHVTKDLTPFLLSVTAVLAALSLQLTG